MALRTVAISTKSGISAAVLVAALILAEAALAQTFGWNHFLPLLAAGLKRADLRKHGDDLRLACHRALVLSAVDAVRLSVDLARRAAHLKAAAGIEFWWWPSARSWSWRASCSP